jgi:crossover junction endodeoxyribonuclease RuvC
VSAFIGIDPGKTGALAVIHPEGAEAWRWPGDVVTTADLLRDVLTRHRVTLCCIEKVASRPGQGVRSVFTFGENFGAWQGLLAAFAVPYTFATPHQWQKAVLDAGGGDTKVRSLNMARRLFPDVDLSRKGDHGMSDALLLALYVKRLHLRGTA